MLGVAHAELGNPQTAVELFNRAIAADARMPMSHHNLGNLLLEMGDPKAAMAAFQSELALNANFAPSQGRLAFSAVQAGDMEVAWQAIHRALRLEPANTQFWRIRTNLVPLFGADYQLASLERLVHTTRDPEQQLSLHLALAEAYEATGQYDDAFRSLVSGNSMVRRARRYHEAATLGAMEEIGRLFTPRFLQERRGLGHPSTKPIFVVGMPRSGTSLVEQILATHPGVAGGGELTFIPDLLGGLPKALGVPADFKELLTSLQAKDYYEFGSAYLHCLESLGLPEPRVVDKMPANFQFLGFIRLAFPNAAIIHVARDPLDTCLSCFATNFAVGHDHTYDLGEMGRYYRGYQRLMGHWRATLSDILDVHYEDLISDAEGQVRRVLSHCGLEWDARCLEFHKSKRAVLTASAAQVRQPIYSKSIGRWRRFEKHLAPLISELSKP
jgi:tetratricopeptide (TPR) repeat protein